ncbi:MAG: winged helix-turn-helix domain-containing protein [Thermoproteota archaeon]
MSSSIKEEKIKPDFKLWFEIGGKYVFGEGTYTLLDQINKKDSIAAAARSAKMSYRHAWDLIKEMEEHLGQTVVKSQKGGIHGGKSELTEAGDSLLKKYKELKEAMTKVCKLG